MIEFVSRFYFPEKVLNLLHLQIIPGFDLWYGVHFCSGMIIGAFIKHKQWWLTFLLLAGFEAFEYYLFMRNLAIFEGWINLLGDLIFGMAGFLTCRKLFFQEPIYGTAKISTESPQQSQQSGSD